MIYLMINELSLNKKLLNSDDEANALEAKGTWYIEGIFATRKEANAYYREFFY